VSKTTREIGNSNSIIRLRLENVRRFDFVFYTARGIFAGCASMHKMEVTMSLCEHSFLS
jgi:hypothetical protein